MRISSLVIGWPDVGGRVCWKRMLLEQYIHYTLFLRDEYIGSRLSGDVQAGSYSNKLTP